MNYDNGKAPITQAVNDDIAQVPKSYFDLSRVHQCQGIIGAEMPIDLIKVLPNDEIDLNYLCYIANRNPLVRELRNGMTVTLHAYYSPCSELWDGWNDYITRGRSGRINKTVPKLLPDFKNIDDNNKIYTTLVPCSPADYMGVPIKMYNKNIENKNYVFKPIEVKDEYKVNNNYTPGKTYAKWGINALPFVMYNKIHRDYYTNQNLLMENRKWFPSNDKEFIVKYNPITIEDTTWGNAETHDYINTTMGEYIPVHSVNDTQYICGKYSNEDEGLLNCLHFRQFRGDYFTTANPFADLIRGNSDEIDQAIGSIGTVNFLGDFFGKVNEDDWDTNNLFEIKGSGLNAYAEPISVSPNAHDNHVRLANYKIQNTLNYNNVTLNSGLLNKMRKALVLEKFMQRNGATNGTYREIIGAQFGYKPNQFDGRPRYIGGSTFDINFNSVVMTSSDTEEQNLGDKVSNAVGIGECNLGKYHVDDYGYIMVIMCIVPDVYYNNQGLDPMWTTTTQDKEYFPIMNNLAPQAIENKELFAGENAGVFGYAERFADYKSRRNIATGLNAVGDKSKFDSNNLMRRNFNSKPNLNLQFVTMYPSNIDLNPFSSVNEIPFDLMIGCKVGAYRPMPYTSKPSEMGIRY